MSDLLLDALTVTFNGHGIACERGISAVQAQDGLTIEPRVFPRDSANGTHQVQVDFAVQSPRMLDIPFLDSFAGLGPSPDDALRNAYGKFLQGSFHVIAESLTSHACDAEQVEWEKWSGRGHSWRVCSGPLLLLATGAGGRIEDFAPFYLQIAREFAVAMPAGPHWMRMFLGALDGRRMGSEVLVDGEAWPAGQALMDGHAWRYPAGYASFRHLLIALPAD